MNALSSPFNYVDMGTPDIKMGLTHIVRFSSAGISEGNPYELKYKLNFFTTSVS